MGQDLTSHGEQELSLWVQNDEYFYTRFLQCEDEIDLQRLVDGHFVYTDEQFDELVDDLETELAEQAKNASPLDED